MSVFTPVTRGQLEQFLQSFELGRLVEHRDIVAGAENSNFFVVTDQGQFVLTLVERGPVAELPFIIELLGYLQGVGLPVPYAIADRHGQRLHQLNDRPALLQPCLVGRHVLEPDASHCRAVGTVLARLHKVTLASDLHRHSDRGLVWMEQELVRRSAAADQSKAQLLQSMLVEVREIQSNMQGLPSGVLHGDLFRDNVLFEGHHLSGIIDFYNAASGPLLYDVAICVNDWCIAEDGGLDAARVSALLGGYASVRPFTPAEAQRWPALLRIAALRFWLSRLQAADEHRGQAGVLCKDPNYFLQLLITLQALSPSLPMAL